MLVIAIKDRLVLICKRVYGIIRVNPFMFSDFRRRTNDSETETDCCLADELADELAHVSAAVRPRGDRSDRPARTRGVPG